jgi:opacity protein-like surface antigen
MRHGLSPFAVAAVLVLVSITNASAQEIAARNTIGVTAGAVNFDLSGTGTTWGLGFRGTRALTSHLAVEFSTLFARPDLQAGQAVLLTPEVHLQYHWRLGSFAPYAGGGIGFTHQSRDGSPNVTNFSLSTAGGLRTYVNDRVALIGEFRLRGIQRDFSATTAEIMGGVSFDIGR